MINIIKNIIILLCVLSPVASFATWNVNFDESNSTFNVQNGDFKISGILTFKAEGKSGENWKISNSRDGIRGRLAIVNDKGDVQAYIVFPKTENAFEIFFYHRTAQAFKGVLSFDATVKLDDSTDIIACRTRPCSKERVLNLSINDADSNLNDSIFDVERDMLLQMSAHKLAIKKVKNGEYKLQMSGEIEESAHSKFVFDIKKDYFKNRYVPYYKALIRKNLGANPTPTGWMSWNTYFDKATAEDNLAEARIGKKYLQPFGCEIWSIESWQGNSDKLPVSAFYNLNLEVNKKQFPKGMKKLAADIRALGFRPGIWIAPFGTGNKDFYEAHKDWFLHDKEGNPIKSWNGIYTVDPTNKELREHLKNIFATAAKDWGYEFFKIDGMSGRNKGYCAHLFERPEIKSQFKDPECANPLELCIQAFREGIGKDSIFLACQGHSSGAEASYAEMARTGADIVHPNKPVQWRNVLLQGRCTINQVFTHNITIIADPDTLLVRDLPIEEARVTSTIVALPGQLTFFGDKLENLPEERMKMLQQSLPVTKSRPASLYPYFKMMPVWNLAVRHEALGQYNVVAFINWNDRDTEISASAEELGISSTQNFKAFEFWTQKALCDMKGTFSQKVPAHGVRLVVLSPDFKRPQYMGSDRHISQCAMEVSKSHWNSEKNALSLDVKLVKDFPLTLWVSLPDNFNIETNKVCVSGSKYEISKEAQSLKITLKEATQSKVHILLPFSKKN